MSRALSASHSDHEFAGFGMPKWSPDINHLAYADDTIVFASANEESLILIMNTLLTYEIYNKPLNWTGSAERKHAQL
ncbi:hypothetical protein H5410_008763 [Solanum commersonii]|uniref:Reverse transcriptase domain-containing protein n=1 Tax=Solanum commersonii TaxID=4109 RepID=A0A9J6AGJ6_SOLCO|nr:hypothetical protein H5410_008763 [Solanum commersonii]